MANDRCSTGLRLAYLLVSPGICSADARAGHATASQKNRTYGLGFLDRTETVIAWLVMLMAQLATAVLAFRPDHEPFRPLWALVLQQIVFR